MRDLVAFVGLAFAVIYMGLLMNRYNVGEEDVLSGGCRRSEEKVTYADLTLLSRLTHVRDHLP